MIVVTGGTGFIGSHTCVELMSAGYEVVILDDLSNSERTVVNAIGDLTGKVPRFYEVDLSDQQALDQVFERIGDQVEAVIHFAAKKAVGESVQQPKMYYRNNIVGLLNLLDQMGKHRIENIVFSSSCTVYGQPEDCPVTERTPRQPAESPYGNTKVICEDILHDVSNVTELRTIALRYFNPIGAHASAKIGELPVGTPNNLIPFVTQTAIGKRQELTVFGDDYPTRDGTCIRDYIHVVDLAVAHVKALQRMEKTEGADSFEVFNVGTGKGSTVLEVIHAFEEVSGQKLNYRFGDRRKGDITEVYADTSVANKELGWKAVHTLEDSLRSAWAWECKLKQEEPTA